MPWYLETATLDANVSLDVIAVLQFDVQRQTKEVVFLNES